MPPLLTIAIPTWNRASYLRKNLAQLACQVPPDPNTLEVFISDNCSTDETTSVIEAYREIIPVQYIRNRENIGSDHNIAQCFNEAAGRYVLILGDDDLLVDGALPIILNVLAANNYGVLSLGTYGYDNDFRQEYPGGSFRILNFFDVSDFIVNIGIFSTLISANIISKELLEGLDARQFCGSNLVQTHLVYQAALKAQRNGYIKQRLVACKRNNSGGYVFSEIFVDRLGEILDQYRFQGLPSQAIFRLEQRLLIGYYPFYIWRQRCWRGEALDVGRQRFLARYRDRWAYRLFVDPIFVLPRPLAIGYGAWAVASGRILNGDLRLGLNFAWNKLIGCCSCR